MSQKLLYVAILVFASPAGASIIDFESIPSTYMYIIGDQNLGSYYPGVMFGSNVTGLDLTDSTAFPPHSGSIAVWDPVDSSVTIAFNDPRSMVGVWYTSFDLLTLSAFDAGNLLLGSVVGSANTDGTTGTFDFLSVSAPNIALVTLSGAPGQFVFDDLTFTPQGQTAVPEPSTILLVLSAAGAMLLRLLKHMCRHRSFLRLSVEGGTDRARSEANRAATFLQS